MSNENTVNKYGVFLTEIDGAIHLNASIDSETQIHVVFDSIESILNSTGKHFEDLTPIDLLHYLNI